MRLTIAQVNPTVGDIEDNLAKAIEVYRQCSTRDNSDLLIFPELFLVGYPPRDLLERDWFIEKAQRALAALTRESLKHPSTGILVGTPIPTGIIPGRRLYNCAVLLYQGQVLAKQAKSLLPIHDVFDEERHFEPAADVKVVSFKDEVLGISVCEDAWNIPDLWPGGAVYSANPIHTLASQGATLLINLSASPFFMGKEEIRYRVISGHARRYRVPFVYVNQVGGNDELVFDGRSLFVDAQGEPIAVLPAFREHIQSFDSSAAGVPGSYVPQDRVETVYEALVLGVRDYIHKCGFSGAVIGLSGGIDSAVTAAVAADAVGAGNVMGITMPSPFSSGGSVEDSRILAERLGIEFKVIPISEVYKTYLNTVEQHFAGRELDVTEENIQARIRGNLLMAFSNKFGRMVLSTGNKSEMAVGYCTLYGDMSGGLAVLADVPKTLVYEVARYINREREIIPASTIDKPPSAELRPDQVDQDTLPPYPVLDHILHMIVEEHQSVEEIAAQGLDRETVEWVNRAVQRSEYKRRQAAPGLKVTTKAFGMGRRMPIAARY